MRRVMLLVGPLTLSILLGGVTELTGSHVGAPSSETPIRHGPVGIGTSSGLSAKRLEMVVWSRDLFLAAGLVPPRVRFVFYEDTRKCRLRRGLFHPSTRTIEICNLNRETLVHELAHAWVDANLTEEAKADFTRHRGLAAWNDHSMPWADRATEHAAEIVAWGVEEESRLISWIEPDGQHTLQLLTIPDSTPEELAMSYQLLTGIPAHPDRIRSQPTLKPAFSPEARRPGSPTG